MKRLIAFGLLAACFAFGAEDLVLKAMRDEIQRAMTLQFNALEKPYYVEYTMDDAHRVGISATLDGGFAVEENDMRIPRIRVRIGSPQFDNTNFTGSMSGYAGRYETHYPLNDDYLALRRALWLATDSAYKSALEAISRKRAALKNLSVTGELPDFGPAKQVHLLRDVPPITLAPKPWSDRVRALAAEFLRFPELRGSTVSYIAVQGVHRLVSSEGGELRLPEQEVELRLFATAQAKDGMMVRDAVTYESLNLDGLPSETELKKTVADLGATVVAISNAPRGEDYTGPVLFEGIAASQLFAELLGRNLALSRRPVSDGNQRGGGDFTPSELEGRIGSRVLPEGFSVTDDPTLKEWKGKALFGTTEVDEDGVECKPLNLIQNGMLKNYLLTRMPMRNHPETNGRARLHGSYGNTVASPTNLIVQAKETTPSAEMKAKLLDMLKQRGSPYAIIVRKFDFPSTGSPSESRRAMGGRNGGGARPTSLPLRVYRLYPDGREELIRAVRFRALSVRSLKDILAAGDDVNVLNYSENGAPFASAGAASETAETSVVAPSVLIDDLELVRMEGEEPKLPLVPSPSMTFSAK